MNYFIVQAHNNGDILLIVPDDGSAASLNAIVALVRVGARIAYPRLPASKNEVK